mmetsp:Transcript_50071/g.119650  ORF Transcript_50071/g.119650 Transcript_50071/m.119650 type:complete len:110 (+) Transcript_50071:122-451(+)
MALTRDLFLCALCSSGILPTSSRDLGGALFLRPRLGPPAGRGSTSVCSVKRGDSWLKRRAAAKASISLMFVVTEALDPTDTFRPAQAGGVLSCCPGATIVISIGVLMGV